MARFNLLTGCAHGKVGQLQFQTRSMKCVVRTKQPEGLTNAQAEEINKPVLLRLSKEYHLWAKYLLSTHKSDYKKPQALWNYYTTVNKPSFENGVNERTGWYVNKHGGNLLPPCTYNPNSSENNGIITFEKEPAAEYLHADVLLVFGLEAQPIERCEKHYGAYGKRVENLPFVAVEENKTLILGFIVSKDHTRLLSGAFIVRAGPDTGRTFWDTPERFINGGIRIQYTTTTIAAVASSIEIDEESVPEKYHDFKWLFTFTQNYGGHTKDSTIIIKRGETPPVEENAEIWEGSKHIAAVYLLDPAEKNICSPEIHLVSTYVLPTAQSFGASSPSDILWNAPLNGNVSLTYQPVMAVSNSALSFLREKITFTTEFASIPSGFEINGLYKSGYVKTGISGIPPIEGRCAKSTLYDSRSGSAVCETQYVEAQRTPINASKEALSECIRLWQSGLLYRNITTETKPGIKKLPVQYGDAVFLLTFFEDTGGLKAADTADVPSSAQRILSAGAGFPAKGAQCASAILIDAKRLKPLSISFPVACDYEILAGSATGPFYMTLYTKRLGGGDIEVVFSIEGETYKNIRYYEGSVECSFKYPVYGNDGVVVESIGEEYPIENGMSGYMSDYEEEPYRGENGSCYFTRENNEGEYVTVAHSIVIRTDIA